MGWSQGSIFRKFQEVPNFQVLLDFYLTISKNFPISVGLRSGRTQTRHQCQGGGGLSPPCPPMNLLPFQIHWNLSQKFPFFWCPFTLLEATFVQIPFEIFILFLMPYIFIYFLKPPIFFALIFFFSIFMIIPLISNTACKKS